MAMTPKSFKESLALLFAARFPQEAGFPSGGAFRFPTHRDVSRAGRLA